jgi:PAS domain S-box-containing protein
MSNESGESKKRFHFDVGVCSTPTELVDSAAEVVARATGADEVIVQLRIEEELFIGSYPSRGEQGASVEAALFEVNHNKITFRGQTWTFPLVINDLQRARVPSELALELAVRKVRSCGAFALQSRGRTVGVVECVFTRAFHRWKQEEIAAFDNLSRTVENFIWPESNDGSTKREIVTDEMRSQYRRLARYGNIIILLTDAEFRIVDVVGNTDQLLGVAASQMMHNLGVWDLLLDPRDRGLLRRRIMRVRSEREELREEVRFIHQRTGEVRWMMLRALPQFSPSGAFQGWEGFGIDTTDRRRAQEALMSQNRRLEALIEVSRALQGQTDPAVVTLRGLRALIRATGSDCGYGCFYHRDKKELELVAAQGLSEKYLNSIGPVLTGPSLLRMAVDSQQGILLDDVQADPRAAIPLAKLEGVHSTIVMPLVIDNTVFGAIVLFKREAHRYTETDFELVAAAATQITLSVRQAESFENERKQSESLAALYKMSHELSKYRTPREIAERAFPILQQEFALKRMWFGIMNDQGTHIAGKAGWGQGVRRQLQEIQIELNLRHDFFDEAIRTQRPVFVEAGQPMECSGLNRLLQRLKLETFLVIPLVSLGHVVGVLVVEPLNPAMFARTSQVQLISSMANEMATVVMSRRFESKMADALKMRMAGLLASGVAHNFNNLLQAVLGQVALIELQVPKGSPALDATKTINEAAKRGAALVSQLLNFAAQGNASKQSVDINRMLRDSKDLYQSLIGSRIEMEFELDTECPEIVIDNSQIQQVVANLLANAKDAIGNRQGGKVEVSSHRVRLRSGEIDPELSPGVYIRIDIKDNGIGMDAEQQLRCFEPFFTTKNVDRSTGVGLAGSGLGLSAAYSIVKQHDGLITVHSTPGEGAVFSIYLPILSVRAPANQALAKQPRVAMKGGVLLLGVEGGVQPFVSSVFESLGYRSRSVFDALQATEVLKNEGDAWNVILLDVDTSPDTAIGDCDRFLAASPDLCVIATSTNAKEWIERLPSSPRIETIEKPFGVWGMESALARLQSRLKGLSTPLAIEKSIDGNNRTGIKDKQDPPDSETTHPFDSADDDAPIN